MVNGEEEQQLSDDDSTTAGIVIISLLCVWATLMLVFVLVRVYVHYRIGIKELEQQRLEKQRKEQMKAMLFPFARIAATNGQKSA